MSCLRSSEIEILRIRTLLSNITWFSSGNFHNLYCIRLFDRFTQFYESNVISVCWRIPLRMCYKSSRWQTNLTAFIFCDILSSKYEIYLYCTKIEKMVSLKSFFSNNKLIMLIIYSLVMLISIESGLTKTHTMWYENAKHQHIFSYFLANKRTYITHQMIEVLIQFPYILSENFNNEPP